MAYKEQTIYNPVTGQNIKFIRTSWDTHGQLLEMESTCLPQSKEPPPHYHPGQVEEFTVIYGKMKVRVDGAVTIFHTGESFHIPRGKVHSMWNDSDNKTILNWQVKPAMSTEFLLETTFALVNDGKANEKGMPKFLQLALTANKFSGVLRLTKPPYVVQKILFTLLTPIAYCLGYRAYYPKYILSEVIKKQTGKTAGEWIDRAIILEAKVLLQNWELGISRISDKLNFSDQSVFGKFFKIHEGISPLEYRKGLK